MKAYTEVSRPVQQQNWVMLLDEGASHEDADSLLVHQKQQTLDAIDPASV